MDGLYSILQTWQIMTSGWYPIHLLAVQDRAHIVMVIRPGGTSFDITAVLSFYSETQHHVKHPLFGVMLKRKKSSWDRFLTHLTWRFLS